MLNEIKVKLKMMGITDPWWSVGSALKLPNCNKWFYDADNSR